MAAPVDSSQQPAQVRPIEDLNRVRLRELTANVRVAKGSRWAELADEAEHLAPV
eukprot:CAMPEP_0181244028 /NCGR_PEP_ID=MMETSP1096-20121128/42620_1 /TAXON_ID=156174 ORGANISM="Chrysochromulina ericina, Strain CCMP281" /NCGR_SAMPLE_ID=MMETSP1096 /ASSEMBLY_ACC=CAM_ASM_000453 /LENGTH=53 /DNA_ID=CAMNT_0023340507 /DNA_START=112 /DNA_END=273 /DNA_ORIENTATION=-